MPDYYADPAAAALVAKAGPAGYEHGWNHVGKPGSWQYTVSMQQRAHEIAHGHLSALENPFGLRQDDPAVEDAEELDEERQQAGIKFWHPLHSDPVIDRLNAALERVKGIEPS